MVYISNINETETEPLINISDLNIKQSVEDGALELNLTTYYSESNAGYELINSESKINVEDYEFTIKSFSENQYSKSIIALSSFFDNSKKQVNNIFSGSHSLINQLNFILSNSGWEYSVDSDISNVVNYIDDLGNDNIISLLSKVTKEHKVEFIILKGKRIRFSKRIGNSQDFQFRYKYNVSDVVYSVDTSSLYTYVRGEGAEGLTTDYTSPNANIFGLLEYGLVKDERFTSVESLQRYIAENLNDTPDITIESSSPLLTERSTGENVWLIYPPLNLEIETRIISQNKTIVDGVLVTSSVVLGNSDKKSLINLTVNQQSRIEENEKELDETKENFRSEIRVTNDRITLEVEEIDSSIAAIDIKADNINLSVNNRITQEVAQINIAANNIQLSVENRITQEVASIDIRANQIQQQVTNLNTSTQSSITQLSNNINLKIDRGGAITDINLSDGAATINANRINLNGAVIVNGSIYGATDIITNRNVAVGNALYFGGVMGSVDFIEIGGGMDFNSTSFNFYGANGMSLNGKRVLTTDDL